MRYRSIIAELAVLVILSGCSETPPNIGFTDPVARNQFENDLQREGIEYEVRQFPDAGEFIVWDSEDDTKVQAILKRSSDGAPQPNSACVTPDSFREQLKISLTKGGIPYEERYYDGMYCVTWDDSLSNQVRALEGGKYKLIFVDEQQKLRDAQQ